MIKSEVKYNTEYEKVIQYPYIMAGSRGLVVLFESCGCGTVIRENDHFDIGYYSTSWVMSHFNKSNGSVTLSNKE